MLSREIVIASLEFRGSERIPMALPPPYPNDFLCSSYRLKGSKVREWYPVGGGKEERIDEWGNVWRRTESSCSKGEIYKGVLKDLDAVQKIELPSLDDCRNYRETEREFLSNKEKFKIGLLPGFVFNIARKMRGFDQYLMDLVLNEDEIVVLNKRIETLVKRAIENYAKAGADAIMFPEDWGTQEQLLINPDLWRKLFKPGFIQLCNTAHKRGIYVFMHSCGYIYPIISDLIEAGIDVLQFDQPALYGIDNLARNFGGKINFWCPVDIQKVLPTKNENLIENFAKGLIGKLGCFNGGFIAGYYESNEVLSIEPHWQDIACRAFVKYGTQRKIEK